MKIRALLLVAILIGGSYTLVQSYLDYKEKAFEELLYSMNPKFSSITFAKPSTATTNGETWQVNEEKEIQELLSFLQMYHIQKLKPEEINLYDEILQFGIQLEDESGNSITVIIDENLIIQNNLLYYRIVDGPLDVDWLVHFFLGNKL